jgi:hypothetical protein
MTVPLLFHHIPKTAGTSLIDIIADNYPGGALLSLYGAKGDKILARIREEGWPPGDAGDGVRCIATHDTNTVIPALDPSFRAFALLRDPVDRVASLYHYLRSISHKVDTIGGLAGRIIVELDWSIGDIFEHLGDKAGEPPKRHRLFNGFFNGQVRHLLHAYLSTDGLGRFEGAPPESHPFVDRMNEELDRRYTLGILEEFRKSIDLFAGRFGWSVRAYPHKRATERPATAEIPEETRALILAFNRLDQDLWLRAREGLT